MTPVTFSGAGVTGTTLPGTDNSDTILFDGGQVTVVFDSAIGTSAQVSFGAGHDMATFNGGLSAASIYGGTGKDTLDFNNVVVNGTTFQGALITMYSVVLSPLVPLMSVSLGRSRRRLLRI